MNVIHFLTPMNPYPGTLFPLKTNIYIIHLESFRNMSNLMYKGVRVVRVLGPLTLTLNPQRSNQNSETTGYIYNP